MYMFNIKLTPETITILPLAIGLDLVGIILICFGLDDFGTTDIIGIVFINSWLLFRGSRGVDVEKRNGTKGKIKKVFKGKTSKFVVPSFLELIPYIGALPCWTLSVLFNLSDE